MEQKHYTLLSHTILRNNIILTLQGTKGQRKLIHVGAHEEDIIVTKLAWIVNDILSPFRFNLDVFDKNSARFIQSVDGEYIFDILPDEKLECTESVTDNDLYVRSNVCCTYKQPIGLEMCIKFKRA